MLLHIDGCQSCLPTHDCEALPCQRNGRAQHAFDLSLQADRVIGPASETPKSDYIEQPIQSGTEGRQNYLYIVGKAMASIGSANVLANGLALVAQEQE